MNEKITELRKQVGLYEHDGMIFGSTSGYEGVSTDELEKFAELIVLECIGIIAGGKNLHDEAPDAKSSRKYITNIKKHFGVE